jgi:hypothetical protein
MTFCLNGTGDPIEKKRESIAESFYYVNYYVKSSSNNLSKENIKTGVSREMIFQKEFILAFQFTFCLDDTRNTSVYVLITGTIWLNNFWHINWQSIIFVVERLGFGISKGHFFCTVFKELCGLRSKVVKY